MRKLWLLAAFMVALFPRVSAAQIAPEPIQNYSIAVYASTATDPNVNAPVMAPTTYAIGGASGVNCGQTKVALPPGTIINPQTARFDDPTDVTKDCVANIVAQISALAVANGYKGAIRANGATTSSVWSAFSNPFNRAAVPPATVTGVRIQ